MKGMVLAVLLAANASGAEVALRSGPGRTRLIELYSSEGCSSCPPADEWIASLLKSPQLWKDFVPIVFQVSYWDYLGWKDRFADPAYDSRQRAYAASWGSRTTYTPGFVLDGAEWRGWGAPPPSAEGAAGTLTATLSGTRLAARFTAGGGPFDAYAARLGFGASSDVTAGENSGRVLKHEFVGRALARAAMEKEKGAWTARLVLPAASGPSIGREGLAVWVAGPDGRPAQAAGGFLP